MYHLISKLIIFRNSCKTQLIHDNIDGLWYSVVNVKSVLREWLERGKISGVQIEKKRKMYVNVTLSCRVKELVK